MTKPKLKPDSEGEEDVFEVIFMVPVVHRLLVMPSLFQASKGYHKPEQWTAAGLMEMLEDNDDMLDTLFQQSLVVNNVVDLDISEIEIEGVKLMDMSRPLAGSATAETADPKLEVPT